MDKYDKKSFERGGTNMKCPCGCEDEQDNIENEAKDKPCICDFTLDELNYMLTQFKKLDHEGHLYSAEFVKRNGRLGLDGEYCCPHNGNICGKCPQYDPKKDKQI